MIGMVFDDVFGGSEKKNFQKNIYPNDISTKL